MKNNDELNESLKGNSALNLVWSFGINRNIPVHNISDANRQAVFYVTAHTGVLYDCITNRQKLLQGHCNDLSCTCVSANKRWLVTADAGDDSMIIIWDSYSCIPVRTIFDPHPGGSIAVCMTADAKYIATLSSSSPQVMSIWDWTTESNDPVCSLTLSEEYGIQNFIAFSSEDCQQLVSNGHERVVFYFWDNEVIHHSAPPLTDEDFNKVVGLFSQSVFQPKSSKVLTGTSVGNIVVWDVVAGNDMPCNRKAFKIVRLQEKGINVVTIVDSYIVTGDVVGHVKFLDLELRLLNWYNKLGGGPIISVSFSHEQMNESMSTSPKHPRSATLEGDPFVVNDFVFGTETANVGLYKTRENTNQFILKQHDAPIHAIAAHPKEAKICIGGYSGSLQLWDYEKKQLVISRSFGSKVMIQCLQFNPTGSLLAMGGTDGSVRILDARTLLEEGEDDGVAVFKHCHDCITHLTFSHDSKYLASADLDHCVTLFQAIPGNFKEPWLYLGKQRAHYKRISDITFGVALDSDVPRLLSLGEDRLMVEYDVINSGIDDVRLISSDRIEQSAVPTCLAWYPPVVKESFLVVANDQFKLKLYNSTTKMCRKTLLGPTYGSPLRKLVMLPSENGCGGQHYMGYITENKVGLQILPLDGNPHKAMALIAHPSHVSNVVSSYDGGYLFTAGGCDSCVVMWKVNSESLEASSQLGGEDLEPFYELLEGGRDGELFQELEDYFYYALLRSQNVDTMEKRETSTRIPLSQVPFVMRALGYYPTEQEVDDLINEVKYSEYVDTGKYVQDVDLGEFIRLYVNHRPVFGLSSADLDDAFTRLGRKNKDGTVMIQRDAFLSVLQNKGEHMTEGELSELLSTLLGIADLGGSAEVGGVSQKENLISLLKTHLPERISADMFLGKVLGFGAASGER
ncbi:cilia- and flagella-associated protein 251-like isoform X2 [Dendronephthya gigantea]|nr:cilia- and flagella-associated protein 251-like isoform X2 [Dendronephthya gigantea]XP_028400298.1 cilia- and flagella-associated protein 251-like isoform X2 [Dendronephthya gigantea]